MTARKYYLDWLRVIAFGLLILFHTGMLYVTWRYNLKSPRLVPAAEWLMLLLSPWRLALLFTISGVAGRFLIAKIGADGFALDRLRRLLVPVLTGMFIVIPPQTWIELIDKGRTKADYLSFWIYSYLAADQTLVKPLHKSMPTWDHLWFLVYLLVYSLIFAFLWSVRPWRRPLGNVLPLAVYLVLPALCLVVGDMCVAKFWPRNDALWRDWGEHIKWVSMFVTGILVAQREDFWGFAEIHRGRLAVIAMTLGALMLADHELWLQGALPPPLDWLSWGLLSDAYAWAMVLALFGFGARNWNVPSAALSYLNEAILPVYVLHQPVLLLSAYSLFRIGLPLPAEYLALVAITGGGSLAFYHFVIRPFWPMRVLFGLKP